MSDRNKKLKVMIAGGGTGGHIFPALALAESFREKDPATDCLFVGTDRGLEKELVPAAGFELVLIRIGALKGKDIWSRLKTIFTLPLALIESFRFILRFQPDLVVGVGGYSSGPVVLAAFLLRKPIILMEQNAIPGLTNRLLSRLANSVFTHFEKAADYFSKPVLPYGNPLRRELLDSFKKTERDEQFLTVLITGGSQGAHQINEGLVEALPALSSFRTRLRFIHQTGKADYETVCRGYEKNQMLAEVFPFRKELGGDYKRADLVVARAGAMTITELTACGRPSLLIPYPYAADGHQEWNAKALSEAGAAQVIDEKDFGEKIGPLLKGFLDDGASLKTMAAAAASLGRPEAGKRIVEDCYKLLGR
ncbi:MAG: undecaprenyldiphospho-muramoylpentapeptide beta-N-acetylglucosaminyltransferase [bacterium]|nr:undecaprenyldiphospho-muramoylpentapeptide beta-N-acetylglucosaminyltransferase [bacterium]